MTRYEEPLTLADGRRITWYWDEDYDPFYWESEGGSTRADCEREAEKLASGEFVALGYIVEKHCSHCDTWSHDDSVWGFVTTNGADVRILTTAYAGHELPEGVAL